MIPPELAHLASDREGGLGEYRVTELERACAALGVHDQRFLGGKGRYRDSGMMGAPTNSHPACFWQADVDTAAHELAAIIREVRPQVIVTYDDNGGYGHPDHIQAHRVTMRAFAQAADPSLPGTPWQARKLYAIAQPRKLLEESVARMQADPGPFTAPTAVEDIAPGTPDDLVTTRIDGSAYWEKKRDALQAHATQVAVAGTRFALSNGIARRSTPWSTSPCCTARNPAAAPMATKPTCSPDQEHGSSVQDKPPRALARLGRGKRLGCSL